LIEGNFADYTKNITKVMTSLMQY